MAERCETSTDCRTIVPLSSLKVSKLYTIPCGFYESPNAQNWMCELCMFSQIQSQLVYISTFANILTLTCMVFINKAYIVIVNFDHKVNITS